MEDVKLEFPTLPQSKEDAEDWTYPMRREMQEILPGLFLGPYSSAMKSKTKEFIDGSLQTGGKVLVHGNAGISRSAALVIAYIMETFGVKYREAFTYVQERRFCINPNAGFVHQLQEYEAIYLAKLTIQMMSPLQLERSLSVQSGATGTKRIKAWSKRKTVKSELLHQKHPREIGTGYRPRKNSRRSENQVRKVEEKLGREMRMMQENHEK
ncbi:serine/threonine/tyrosine-interacting protein isoform X2 [Petaurus breviceps papuanus]|uniref:serine/threonine/tyrosine-interacting protein isoform X2 n=1 Tax=Petaurus breviceps papuanus TaxID=3040969 RepID=UPI0036D7FC12